MNKNKKLLILIAGILFLTFIISSFSGKKAGGSTFDQGELGVKAFYLLLERHNLKPQRYFYPYSELKSIQSKNNILFLSDLDTDPNFITDLLDWIKKDNKLVILGKMPAAIADAINANNILEESIRVNFEADKDFSKEAYIDNETRKKHPLELGSIYRISELESRYFGIAHNADNIIDSKQKTRAFVTPYGNGQIWYFSSVFPISNRYIDGSQNIELFYNLVKNSSQILFDEFHHGYHAPVSVDKRHLWNTNILLIINIFIIILLLTLSRAIRFFPFKDKAYTEFADTTELAKALGLIYKEQKISHVLKNYLEIWLIRAKRQFHLQTTTNQQEIIDLLREKKIIDQSESNKLKNIYINENNLELNLKNNLEFFENILTRGAK
ncbi:MAG: DUF4350 domain-containing protein [Proteobacteria bacterium]|nr:DUF4350 domain-containing protein [Pseudomonadota bacterium]